MKLSNPTAYALGVLAALLGLAGCGNQGPQQQFVSSQTRSHTAVPDVRNAAGSGKQKVGKFWWVWHTESLNAKNGIALVEADCPDGYLPTGGGYAAPRNGAGGFAGVVSSYPLHDDTVIGWAIDAFYDGTTSKASVTVWVICAPMT